MIWQRLQCLLGRSLRRQLMIGMVLTVALMMSLFVWDMTRRQQAAAREHQSEQAVAMARSVAAAGSVWVASRDFSGLQEIVQGLSSYPDLRYAMVLDLRGQVLAHSEPGRLGFYLNDLPVTASLTVQRRGALVDVFAPVRLNTRLIGWVRIGMSGATLQAQLAQITRNGVLNTLVAVVISALFAAWVSRLMTRRLAAITRVAGAVQAGHSGLHAQVEGVDEAAQLARQFNAMLDALAERDVALKASETFKTVILDSVAAEIAVLDAQGVILAVNEHWRSFARDNSCQPGQPPANTDIGSSYLQVCAVASDQHEPGAAQARDGILAVLEGRLPQFSLDYPCHTPQQPRWFTMVAKPLVSNGLRGAVITHSDISAVKEAEQYEKFRSQMLELLADDANLDQSLNTIASGIEQLRPGMLCSILLPDDEARHFVQVIAPGLPQVYHQTMKGTTIGIDQGVCAEAVLTGKPVVVANLATHTLPARLAAMIRQVGLVACWAQPIVSSGARVLGTLVIYQRQTQTPTVSDRALIEQSARLAGITIDHKQTQAALRTSEDTFRTLFETAPVGVVYQNTDGYITAANPAAQRILGLTLDQLQGRTSMDPHWHAIHEDGTDFPGDQHPIVQALRTGEAVRDVVMGIFASDEDCVWILVSAMPLFKEGQVAQAYVVFEDVTERQRMQQRVHQLAFYDPLTQLPNRRLLKERLSHALVACKRSGCFGAMMFLDLDNFKPLNDRHGHEVGDLLLVEVARRLRDCVRRVDTVARLGGDEFVVMLTDLHANDAESAAQASMVAEKIRASLTEPYRLSFQCAQGGSMTVAHHCSASIGLTLFSSADSTQEQILQRADAAMYQAKDQGRNRVQFYQQQVIKD